MIDHCRVAGSGQYHDSAVSEVLPTPGATRSRISRTSSRLTRFRAPAAPSVTVVARLGRELII